MISHHQHVLSWQEIVNWQIDFFLNVTQQFVNFNYQK